MGSKVAKMLLRTQKQSAFRFFSPTFKRAVFEKGLFRQFQRLALLECPCLGRGFRISLKVIDRRERGRDESVWVVRPQVWERSHGN